MLNVSQRTKQRISIAIAIVAILVSQLACGDVLDLTCAANPNAELCDAF